MKKFLVLDSEYYQTSMTDEDRNEGFDTRAEAETRAVEEAADLPSAAFGIYKLVATVEAEVKDPIITTVEDDA